MGSRLLPITVVGVLTLLAINAQANAPVSPNGAGDGPVKVEIQLLTMGPGAHLYTRGGHAALIVVRYSDAQRFETQVYNYGDADWDDPDFNWKFIAGELQFFLSSPGDLVATVDDYAGRQARSMWRQTLALTEAQAREIMVRLTREARPENRNYTYHHVESSCTTRIRDLLDEVLGGAIKTQLSGKPDPMSPRDYQRRAFEGHFLEALAVDLFMGRVHDQARDQYYTLFHPPNMRTRFQTVMVPDPSGSGQQVPLASAPMVLAERQGGPVISGESQTVYVVFGVLLFLLLGLGLVVARRPETQYRVAGCILGLWALISGLIGAGALFFTLISSVPEIRDNELLAVFIIIDWVLLLPAIQWYRHGLSAPPWLRAYVGLRALMVLAVCLLRLTGTLYQEPAIVPLVACLVFLGLFALLIRIDRWRQALNTDCKEVEASEAPV
jgi:hypothetical protein